MVSTSVSDVQSPDEPSIIRHETRQRDRPLHGVDGTSAWQRVLSLAPPRSLADLFADDPDTRAGFVVTVGDLTIDVSRQQIDRTVLGALLDAAEECGVRDVLARMVSGSPINTTEHRAVGHMALRMPEGSSFDVDGVNVVPVVQDTLTRMTRFAEGVRSGTVTGATGQAFSTVVNIGIGGSDLGPRLVHDAVGPGGEEGLDCRFAANVDPDDLSSTLRGLDPARTLFVVSSKTFTTSETLMNARAAAEWVRGHLGDTAVRQHVVAVSADERAVRSSGLGVEIVFSLWDWVGGRYSIGSAVGLSAMLGIGPRAFLDLLSGMRDIDEHILSADSANNVPLLMALIGVWNHAVLGYATRAVIPYAHRLGRLPAYLQQLIMESNGKSVRVDGTPVGLATSPVIWGDVGTNAQHAFMQLLHQGTAVVPVDFIGFAATSSEESDQALTGRRTLFLNMVAQAQALAFGRSPDAVSGDTAAHRSFPGNRPSTVIVAPRLEPRVLGQIIALYEHAVFYEGVLLGINSFDQWGVELGKEMASTLMNAHRDRTEDASAAERAGVRLVTWFDDHTDQKRP